MDKKTITIVSGLPRSGTSMMMGMLEAGGMGIMTDTIREADEDNPKGYFELEQVKQLETDSVWLKNAQGKVVKIISTFLRHLPSDYNYRIIFMLRNMQEILNSQKQMLLRRSEATDKIKDEEMGRIFSAHLKKMQQELPQQPNVEALFINYNKVIKEPTKHIKEINYFLGNILDENNMQSVISKRLYRQQGDKGVATCATKFHKR